MKRLTTFAEVPFDDDNISIDELLVFTTDHIGRLQSGESDPLFVARIAATQEKLAFLRSCLVANGTKLGQRRGSKVSKSRFRRSISPMIGRFHAFAVAEWGPKSALLKEIFPDGRRIFSRCPDDMLTAHLNAMLRGLKAHESVLGAEVVAQAETVAEEWGKVHAASEQRTAAKAATENELRQARRALQLELFLNLLAIAQKYPRQPEKITRYMQQSLLEDRPRKKAARQ